MGPTKPLEERKMILMPKDIDHKNFENFISIYKEDSGILFFLSNKGKGSIFTHNITPEDTALNILALMATVSEVDRLVKARIGYPPTIDTRSFLDKSLRDIVRDVENGKLDGPNSDLLIAALARISTAIKKEMP